MYDIITIGSATRDVFLKSKDFQILKDKRFVTSKALCFPLGSKIGIEEIFFSTGGGGTNSAVTFSRLGLRTAYLGKIGKDTSGEEIIRRLKKEKVSTSLVKITEGSTGYSLILSLGKARTILVYRGVSNQLLSQDIDWSHLRSKWFYIAPLSGKSAGVFKELVDFAYQNKIKIAVNPSSTQLKWGIKRLKPIVGKVDILILNQEEASYLTGIDYKKEREIFSKIDEWIPGIAVMTKGPKGVVVSDGEYFWEAGIFPEKELVDRTGAGDAFGSGFTAGLILSKDDIEYAIRLATANATSMVEHIGAKEGILSKKDFQSRRWRRLEIKKQRL